MFSHEPLVDSRSAAFTRLASRVLETLNEAIEFRGRSGASRKQISDKIGCHRSQLTRVLNGNISNLTLRTISDILWATDFDPRDFSADPIEQITQNCPSHDEHESEYRGLFRRSPVVTIDLSEDARHLWMTQPATRHIVLEHTSS